MSIKFYTSREAAQMLDVHPNSLRKWADKGEINCIRTKSGQRRYDVDSYIGKSTTSTTICYCRLSNHDRKGLRTILERAMSGTHITLVVAHRDRLARFGVDLIRQVFEQNGGKLVVLEETFFSLKQ
jgi:predicted site-specific integrase-resolvase